MQLLCNKERLLIQKSVFPELSMVTSLYNLLPCCKQDYTSIYTGVGLYRLYTVRPRLSEQPGTH